MSIAADIQKLDPGAVVTLFELDATAQGGSINYFHAGTNELNGDVVWQGNTYAKFPIVAEGFEYDGTGQIPRPTLTISNVTGLIGALVRDYDDLVGAKVTRRRTFVRYLDAANFSAGNPSADPNAAFADEIYFVSRKAFENQQAVQFELAAAFDVEGVMLPRRPVIQNVCTWIYRSSECGYAGGPVADVNDVPTNDANVDECGKRLNSCRLRFGDNAELPFGGFPGVDIL